MGDLVHDEIGMPEEAMNPVVEVDADIVLVFLQAEVPEVEIFQPVIIQLHCDCRLNKGKGYEVLRFDDFAELQPTGPVIGEIIERFNEDLSGLLRALLFVQDEAVKVEIQSI